MAVLETIRVKFGIVITVIIAVALLSFIIDPQTLQQVWNSVSSGNEVGVIDNKSVSYEEFQREVEKFTVIYEMNTNSSTKTEEEQKAIYDNTWQSFIDKYLFVENAQNAGINVSDEELVAILSGDIDSPVFRQNQMFFDENGMFSKQRVIDFSSYAASDESGRFAMYWNFMQNTARTQMYYAKYNSLLNQSNFTNPLMLENKLAENNNTFDVEFVMLPVGYAQDSTIVVSDSEIKKYYNEHKKMYRQQASRDIEYVVFEIKPSASDIKAANDAINSIYDEFASTANIKPFLSSNSDRKYDAHWYKEGELNVVSRKVNDYVFSSNATVSDVISDNGSFYAVRVLESKNVPEEVYVKIADANAADSVLNAVEPRWIPQTEGFEDVMTTPKNSKITINGVTFKVLDTKNPVLRKRVAILEKKPYASEETKKASYSAANTFATKAAGGYDNFKEAADSEKVYAHPVRKMLESNERLGSVNKAKEVTRWAFAADKGDVSGIIPVDNKYFVVAVLTGIHKEGYTPVSEVSMMIKDVLYSEKLAQKKAAEVAEQIAGLESMTAVAEVLGTTVSTKEGVAFQSMNSQGLDPMFIGAASVAEEGKICGPVAGNIGVYVYKVVARHTGEAFTEDDIKNQNAQFEYYASQLLLPTMMDDAEVKDNRARFF